MAIRREIKAPLIGMGFLASIAYVTACFAFVESLDVRLPSFAASNVRMIMMILLVTCPAWALFEILFRMREDSRAV